jgi:MFS-type transporter involved in bile tolerance (Atg22 family)
VFAVFVLIPETLTIHVKPQCTEDITMKKHVAHGVRDIVQSLRMLKDINIPLCLVTFFFAQVRFVAGSSTLVQYITTNFGWTMAQTTIFLSPLGIIEIMILTSLPRISEIMTSRLGFTSFGKDLYLTQVSFLVLTISAFTRAVSSSIWLFLIGLFMGTFGSAESALARATVSAYVEPSHTSRLFALAGTVDVLGSFAAGPAMAWLFDKGMRWGGIWTGLPWFYLGLTSGLCWLGLRFARSPKKGCDHEGVFGDGEVGNSRTRNLLD